MINLPKLIIKKYSNKGDLNYIYSPLHNYRYKEDKYYYNGEYYNTNELPEVTDKELVLKYSLVDFITKKLDFDITHPIDILPQWSYDGSVNLIINDGKTFPKLINTRFSVLGDNKYQIIDRQGNNDTNIYNDAEDFNTSISLYKNYNLIPKIKFLGTTDNGNLSVGNYHFYFRYVDSDGNETDFIGESGLVSVFKGSTRTKVNTGFKNENSHKAISFKLTNLDTGFQYINVYYTRSSAEANQNKFTNAYKIATKFMINSAYECVIRITGTEEIDAIDISEINPTYLIAKSVKTQTICQNRLFFGNIQKGEINYRELADLSLYFAPQLKLKPYKNGYDPNYTADITETYQDVNFIYNYVGYQNNEIYRFGIVYILNDNTLSPVFNIRGAFFNNDTTWNGNVSTLQYSTMSPYNENNQRVYLQYNESTGIIEGAKANLENIYGVTKVNIKDDEFTNIIGINIQSLYPNIITKLQELGIKGYFFVRQPRIPLKICQALTIGVLGEEGIPAPKINNGYYVESFHKIEAGHKYQELTYDYKSRIYTANTASKYGALCPDYDVNYEYLNQFFCGEQFYIKPRTTSSQFLNTSNERVYKYNLAGLAQSQLISTYILGVEDNVKQVGLNKQLFTARAGDAEDSKTIKIATQANVRSAFGPYLALDGYNTAGTIIDIYNRDAILLGDQDLLNIRAADVSSYEAISDRYTLDEFNDNITYYRGDSYICTFTHRLNRNFQSTSAPTNDTIVDTKTWANYDKDKSDSKVNIGDLNAVKIGAWFTFPIISNSNLNIRSVDFSYAEESTIMGHGRGFYPYYPANAIGATKIPEGLCYNKGFNTNLSSRFNFALSNIPAIKNDFSNRIAYSDISVNDAFKNGFRVFQGTHFRDYPKTYGAITKILESSGDIICVFEHGIALIPINERAVAAEGNGGYAYINTSNVLPENPNILSDMYGSQWKDSIIKTEKGIYGVDTVAKKIWVIKNGQVECISDLCINEFLNNNINLTEKETTPIIGIKNVKTHYNPNKQDIMFTFYKDSKCWNVCYNEMLSKWMTFYSWIPSFTESINNTMFSFNRDSSKYIAELASHLTSSSWAQGITTDTYIIDQEAPWTNQIIPLSVTETCRTVTYEILDKIPMQELGFDSSNKAIVFNGNLGDITTEYYERSYVDANGIEHIVNPWTNKDEWVNMLYNNNSKIIKPLSKPFQVDKLVIYVDVKAKLTYDDDSTKVITTKLAFISKHNIQYLTTDFWKHGQAGIIDTQNDIKPTNWYGEQHPFEFEFVVSENADMHKIFTNLEIISNKAKPESFHYEIVGEVYNFAKDKKNMYVRQEATKHLWKANNVNIEYDTKYSDIKCTQNFKSADLYHKYYDRADYSNIVYDSYQEAFSQGSSDYSHISGTEIVYYKNRNEFRIWEHTPAIDIDDQQDTNDSTFGGRGLIASNMQYREDRWLVQINPIVVMYKNEYNDQGISEWNKNYPPIYVNNSPIPNKVYEQGAINIPTELAKWNIIYEPTESSWVRSEVALKDRFVKIRIRYKGDELAIINYIKTIYEQSFS